VPDPAAEFAPAEFALSGALLTDLYQFTMMQAYLAEGTTGPAVFELFVRRLPPTRSHLVAAGLEQALGYLERLCFGPAELAWLRDSGRFSDQLLAYLETFRFAGSVDAVPEGTPVFADEPILRVVAPLPQAQFVESRLLNLVHFQTLVASKAARIVAAAAGRPCFDFGMRRAHGAEAGLMAARASYLAGFAGTATVLAEAAFGIPLAGTMAHSFIQVHDEEPLAFQRFAEARPQHPILLIDTYDTERAAARVVALAPRLAAEGIAIEGVRFDSGDLGDHARKVRAILDAGALTAVRIVASGGLDEAEIDRLVRTGAPIDVFGVGTSLTTSADAPALDAVYKLQEYAGIARRKRSEGKATWPGRKQVWRRCRPDGVFDGDTLGLQHESHPGEPLLKPVMRDGRRLSQPPTLQSCRARCAEQLARLPAALRGLAPAAPWPVEISAPLRTLAAECDRREPRD
jgi:nicotinate phosphoribosyltransferase